MITAKRTSSNEIIQFKRLWYEFKLDEYSTFEIILDGQDQTNKDKYSEGNEITIYRNGTIEMIGQITSRIFNQSGGLILLGKGREKDIIDTKCPIDSGTNKKVYTSTNDDTIFQDLISEVTGWTSDVSNSTAVSLDSFRTSQSMSVWNAISRLVQTTGKDLYIDQENKTAYIYDRYPSARSNNFELIEGRDIDNIEKETKEAISKVVVYGKGDGDAQITGSSGSGKPVQYITDRNVISTSEANKRAESILNVLQTSRFYYTFSVLNPSLELGMGQGGIIGASSIQDTRIEVDIVRVLRSRTENQESLKVDVTNPELRRAKKTRSQIQSGQIGKDNIENSSMNGTTNVLDWGGMINAKDTAPLNLTFNVPSAFTTDEANNMRVSSFTLDYDVDPFRSSIGTASEDDVAPDVLNSSGNTQPGVSGSAGSNDAGVSGTSSTAGTTDSGYYFGSYQDRIEDDLDGTWNQAGTYVNIGSSDYLFHGVFVSFGLIGATGTGLSLDVDLLVRVYNSDDGEYFPDSSGIKVLETFDIDPDVAQAVTPSMYIHIPKDWKYGNCKLQYKSDNVSSYIQRADMTYAYHGSQGHSHGDGSYSASSHAHSDGSLTSDNHGHSDGTYSAGSHNHNVSVGDDVSDSGSLNATEVDIYLDYWNGSSWDNKHSILNTGKTLDTDVDISDGETYPDASGYWRVRVYTDSASPDLVKAIAKIKHEMDN